MSATEATLKGRMRPKPSMTDALLAIDDLGEDLNAVLTWAIEFKRLWKSGDEVVLNFMPLDTLTVGCIYEKPSTRTRVSFEVGIDRLGGNPLTLLKNDIQLGTSETVSDTAKVLSRFLGAITYRCYAHADVTALAEGADVPVINALSDKHHPCQAAADLMTVMEAFDTDETLQGIRTCGRRRGPSPRHRRDHRCDDHRNQRPGGGRHRRPRHLHRRVCLHGRGTPRREDERL